MKSKTTEAKQCPRCHAFELILDERSHKDNNVEWCLVCGFVRDDNDGDIPLPHYSIQYRLEGVSIENLMDIEDLHGCMPVDDLVETEAWLKNRESALSLSSSALKPFDRQRAIMTTNNRTPAAPSSIIRGRHTWSLGCSSGFSCQCFFESSFDG